MKHANLAVFVPHIGCPNRCSFCNQNSISGAQNAPSPDDVKKICDDFISSGASERFVGELAFFGGSFTAIPREYMLSLLQAAQPYVKSKVISGIRLSTRPDAIDEQVLELLKDYGVTAIELGAQSMDDEVLRLNRRGHTAQDVINAASLIHNSGIELGVQMMVGLYGDTAQSCIETARQLIKLNPSTVRIYPTVVIKGTQLDMLYKKGEYSPLGVEEAVEICTELLGMFTKAGVRVIRLGLHASQTLENDMTAGAYHPAFRELCESRIYLKEAQKVLKDFKKGSVKLLVSEQAVSKMTGQKRCNIKTLEQQGYKVKVAPSSEMELYKVRAEQE
ncbi:MAG: radical SAM protein [Oscillospiraceae bacterium]|nr:radical SAM protein [Oscillospiraceae bacterium]